MARLAGRIHLRSRNDKDFNTRYPTVAHALAAMPDETVIDGVHRAPLAFDVMVFAGMDVMNEPLSARRQLLRE